MQKDTKITYHIPILCILHILNNPELPNIKAPPRIEESISISTPGRAKLNTSSPVCIVNIKVPKKGIYLKSLIKNSLDLLRIIN